MPVRPALGGSSCHLMLLLKRWDNGTSMVRAQILRKFVDSCPVKSHDEIEQHFANYGDLFFTRLTAWLRLITGRFLKDLHLRSTYSNFLGVHVVQIHSNVMFHIYCESRMISGLKLNNFFRKVEFFKGVIFAFSPEDVKYRTVTQFWFFFREG